jgi:exopolysaccharide production protein ExoQ
VISAGVSRRSLGVSRVASPSLRICPNALLTGAALLSLLFVVWFQSLAALGFLASGLALWARQPGQAVTDLLRFWPIHLIAVWCLLSTFWSNDPAITLRLGIQLALTLVIAVAMATRLSPRTFVRVAFAAFGIAAVSSLLFGEVRGDGAGWLGIFGSKNEFAFAMSVVTLLSLALVLDRQAGWIRIPALLGLLLGPFLLIQGQSAGAILTTAGAGLLGLALVTLRHARLAARLLALALAVLVALAVALLVVEYRIELAEAFLDATGKDVTLTGRTELWSEALREIRAYPLFGQGFQAVWVPGNPVAEAMWARFGIGTRSGFNFHNTWISNAVEIGLVGVGLQLAVFLTTLALVARWVVATQTAASLFFAMFMARQVATSLVEVVVYFNFNVITILTVVALVYGLRVQAEASSHASSRPASRRLAHRGSPRPVGMAPLGAGRSGRG